MARNELAVTVFTAVRENQSVLNKLRRLRICWWQRPLSASRFHHGPLPCFGSGRKAPVATDVVMADSGQDFGEATSAIVVDVVVTVAPQPDEVVGAGVRDVVVAVAEHLDEVAGAAGADLVVAVAENEDLGRTVALHVDLVIAVSTHADELSGAAVARRDVVVALADGDDELADVAHGDVVV